MTSMMERLLAAGVISAMSLLLAACGNQGAPAETAAEVETVASEAMPAEEMIGDMGLDESAMDATMEMAPPADPMMTDAPAETPAP